MDEEVICSYCHTHYDAGLTRNCPNCGANQFFYPQTEIFDIDPIVSRYLRPLSVIFAALVVLDVLFFIIATDLTLVTLAMLATVAIGLPACFCQFETDHLFWAAVTNIVSVIITVSLLILSGHGVITLALAIVALLYAGLFAELSIAAIILVILIL